ncbi:hypothetical protein TNCV_1617741 [Trichonephila clavipes]|nr:hypothetical protein TNCV_1617741 [Trichonephila clavipes]
MSQHETPSEAERLKSEPTCFFLHRPDDSFMSQALGTFCELSFLAIDGILCPEDLKYGKICPSTRNERNITCKHVVLVL